MIHPSLDKIHMEQISRPLDFEVGDTVKVHYKIKEGDKERIQLYEGIVIGIRNKGVGKSIVVRRISFDVGVERVFPVYAPTIDKIEKIRSAKVRRSKLYYLREKVGKQGRLKEVKKAPLADKIYTKALELQKSTSAPVKADEQPQEAAATPEATPAPAENKE